MKLPGRSPYGSDQDEIDNCLCLYFPSYAQSQSINCENYAADYYSPYHFNGKELDQETGNQYYGARYYDPKVSVWLSVDPLAQDYPSLSPYTFVANNPVHAIDPDGNWPTLSDSQLKILNDLFSNLSEPNTYLTVKGESGEDVAFLGELSEIELVDDKPERTDQGQNAVSFDLSASIDHLNTNAFPSYQNGCGKCARAVRLAIDAGGIDTDVRGTSSTSAKDYGANLEVWGFEEINKENYVPQKGDVRIIQPPQGETHGHMNMYNGERWVSDFIERDYWPGPAYRREEPDYQIFRHRSQMNIP